MPRYAAFLRGVSPMNCKMPALQRCLEDAGLTEVATVLSSGNAVFTARSGSEAGLEKKIEAALERGLGRAFPVCVRSIRRLEALLERDPFASERSKPGTKRVVTFLKSEAPAKLRLPAELEGARLFKVAGGEAFTTYVPTPGNPVFMVLIERTLGKDVTTRTWETIRKVVAKGARGADA